MGKGPGTSTLPTPSGLLCVAAARAVRTLHPASEGRKAQVLVYVGVSGKAVLVAGGSDCTGGIWPCQVT